MKVRRIVANIATRDTDSLAGFYRDVFDLDLLMDLDWIKTLGAEGEAKAQLSVASEGGSGTAVPDLSIEVDDLDEALDRVRSRSLPIEYGPVTEPWGARRFFVRDPAGTLLNVLVHG